MTRVGLAGAGWVSQHHLDAWSHLRHRPHGRATVVAIADPDVSAARSRAAAYEIPSVYASVEAMLAGEELDAIDIAAPREAHAPICRMAAHHGLAILCQKPLAPTLAEAEALVADVEGLVRLMVHENWRFRPHYRRIHEWLRRGHLGDVRAVTMSILTSGLLPDERKQLPAIVRQPMFRTLERFLLMEVLIHHVDTLRFLLGPFKLRDAVLKKRCPATRGEDRVDLSLTTDAGAPVSVVGDFMAPGYPPDQFDRLEITGTRGMITLELNRLSLRGDIEEELVLDLPANYKASYAGAISHFVDRLSDGGAFETSPEDNLETLRIVEEAYERSRSWL
ncbi:MAG TPA: Gfo/Idh/MocA family oxidoreductase [Vicinamibacterales bacterium]|nr:Gfo/Idh/MocA family oxidoreductase [Vicinamibacterales bacterium]